MPDGEAAEVGARDFPADFLWGASTAAHQVEGGLVGNDWWAWEHRSDSPAVEPSGDGIDHYHRYADDVALLAALGHTAHRFSIEWSRVEPAPGEFSRAAVQHYRRVLACLRDHDVEPFVTLQHFTLPRWLSERGGWLAREAVDRFARFADHVATGLGDLVTWYATINEPSALTLYGYEQGVFPPGRTDPTAARRVTGRLVAGHRAARQAVLSHQPSARVGLCLALAAMEPARPDGACEAAVERLRRTLVQPYLDGYEGEYLGVQYYTRWRIDPREPDDRAPVPAGLPTTQMGWELHPAGLREVLHTAAAAGAPLVVTENGIATTDDRERVAFLRDHLAEVAGALVDGLDVRGYLHWSAFDNFEWNDGYRPLFGLVGIDRGDDLRRRPRPSAHALARVARSGRLADLEDPDGADAATGP